MKIAQCSSSLLQVPILFNLYADTVCGVVYDVGSEGDYREMISEMKVIMVMVMYFFPFCCM